MSFHPDKNLPDCMMPDGGECCASHTAIRVAWHKQASELVKYRNAILWAVDYFGVDCISRKERFCGVAQLADVLRGVDNNAAGYVPNEWDDSAVFAQPVCPRSCESRNEVTVINLPFPPSLNNMFINGQRGRFRSQKYDSWIQEAGTEIMRQRPSKVAGPVILTFEFQEGRDNRKRDISNLVKAPEDLLVKHGIIEADDGSIVRSITSKWTPEVEGVRITIKSMFKEPAA